MPFDFLELLPFFFVAMALLLERAPTRRNSGALQMNADEPTYNVRRDGVGNNILLLTWTGTAA